MRQREEGEQREKETGEGEGVGQKRGREERAGNGESKLGDSALTLFSNLRILIRISHSNNDLTS